MPPDSRGEWTVWCGPMPKERRAWELEKRGVKAWREEEKNKFSPQDLRILVVSRSDRTPRSIGWLGLELAPAGWVVGKITTRQM